MNRNKLEIYCSDPARRNDYALVGYSNNMWNKDDEWALHSFGCEVIFAETEPLLAGSLRQKKALRAAMAAIAPGGCLVVADLTRLAPSVVSLNKIAAMLDAQNAHLVSLQDGVDSRSILGFFDVLASLAGFEHKGKVSAIRRGMSSAQKRGVKHGRPRKFSHELEAKILEDIRQGVPDDVLAKRHNVSVASIIRLRRKSKRDASG